MIVDKKKSLERITLEFIFVYAMFARYFEIVPLGNKVILVLMIACVTKNFYRIRRYLSEKKDVCSLILLVIIALFFNVLLHGVQEYTKSNLMILLYGIVIIWAIDFLTFVLQEKVSKILYSNFYLLNFFGLANIFIVFMQLQGTGFMIKMKWLQMNSFYLDQCCGIFGNSGTHELSFFLLFIFAYNWCYSEKCKKENGIVIKLYTIITTLLMLIFSTKNDNKAFLISFPCMIGGIIVLKYFANESSSFLKARRIISVLFIMCLGAVILSQNSMVRKAFLLVKEYFDYFVHVDYLSANGGNERLGILMYALKQGNGYMTGVGIGKYGWEQGNIGIFSHFGLSSIGAFTLLGGVWFYILICLLYTSIINKFWRKYKMKMLEKIMLMIAVVFFSAYSNIFTSMVSTIWIMLMFMMIAILCKKENHNLISSQEQYAEYRYIK